MNLTLAIPIFILYALSSSSGLIVLKMAMSAQPVRLNTILSILVSQKFIIGFGLYLVGFLTWMFIISKFRINFAFPIAISLFFIVTGLGSYFILKEPITLQHLFGILFCLIGIMLIVLK